MPPPTIRASCQPLTLPASSRTIRRRTRCVILQKSSMMVAALTLPAIRKVLTDILKPAGSVNDWHLMPEGAFVNLSVIGGEKRDEEACRKHEYGVARRVTHFEFGAL